MFLNIDQCAEQLAGTWGGGQDDPHALRDGWCAEARRLRAHLAGEEASRHQRDVVQVDPGLKQGGDNFTCTASSNSQNTWYYIYYIAAIMYV